MSRIKSVALSTANFLARPFGLTVVPTWRWAETTNGGDTFTLDGVECPYFVHHHNCGRHPGSATERTIELALADEWLARQPAERVVEVGAVTPYYWPGRVKTVIDPADAHPLVTDRAEIADADLRGKAVLCISTLEHVGSGEYGLPADPAALHRAIDKLASEADSFLVTIPVGYTPQVDAVLFDQTPPAATAVYYVVRADRPPYWREVRDPSSARIQYGDAGRAARVGFGANAVVVWVRGGWGRPAGAIS
jgi:hypothetical protein